MILEGPFVDRNVHGPHHGVDIQAATIWGQRSRVEVLEIFFLKPVKKVSNFLLSQEVAQLAELPNHTSSPSLRCRPSPATSTQPNRCYNSLHKAAGGWCHIAAAITLASIALPRLRRFEYGRKFNSNVLLKFKFKLRWLARKLIPIISSFYVLS